MLDAANKEKLLDPLVLSFEMANLQSAMLWLWAINLRVFATSRVNYAKVFDLDNTHLIWKEIMMVIDFTSQICNITI